MAEPTPIRTGAPCPVCRKPSLPQYRPFCSSRCADVDLGRWFSESYRVPALPAELSDEEDVQQDDSEG